MASVPDADLDHILAHTTPLWQEMAEARIFITGGTGFFGIWLLEAISAANDRLKVDVGATVLSRDPQRFLARMPHLAQRAEFDWLTGDPTSFAFPSNKHDYILHLATATSAHLGWTDPIEMLKAKLSAISHVLDYGRCAAVRRLLVTSSGAVYGPQPEELSNIPETYGGGPNPMDPDSAYGNGKRLVEQMCSLTPEVDTVVARCFSFIGPHLPLNARFAAGNFIRDALAGGPIVVKSDGRALRSYLHAADLTIWLLTILVRGKSRRAYNVGSDAAISVLELARSTSQESGRPIEVQVPAVLAPGALDIYIPDVARARRELMLDVWIDLPDALQRTLSWASHDKTIA